MDEIQPDQLLSVTVCLFFNHCQCILVHYPYDGSHSEYEKSPNHTIIDNLFKFLRSGILNKQLLLNQKIFELQADDIKYIASPIMLKYDQCFYCENKDKTQIYLSSIITVPSDTNQQTISFYIDILKKIGRVLINEDKKSGLLLSEIAKLVNIYEKEVYPDVIDIPKLLKFFRKVAETSSLAKFFGTAFSQLSKCMDLDLVFNNSSRIQMSLAEHQLSSLSSINGPVTPQTSFELIHGRIRSYHSLILYKKNNIVMLEEFESFLRAHSTIISLSAIADRMGESWERVRYMAAYLIYWGMASLIFPITGVSMYKTAEKFLESECDMHVIQNKFSRRFPHHSLLWVLNKVVTAVPLSQILEIYTQVSQAKFIEMIEWLMWNDVLVQIHYYFFLFESPTEEIGDLRDMKNLSRVSAYLNGEFHFEEIMHICGIKRGDLLRVINTFGDHIIVDIRSDPSYEEFKFPCT